MCHHYFFRKDKSVLNIFYSPNKISFFICKFQFKKWFLKALDVLKAIISNRTTSFLLSEKISALNYSFKWIISSFCKQFRFFFSIKASYNRDKLWNFSLRFYISILRDATLLSILTNTRDLITFPLYLKLIFLIFSKMIKWFKIRSYLSCLQGYNLFQATV